MSKNVKRNDNYEYLTINYFAFIPLIFSLTISLMIYTTSLVNPERLYLLSFLATPLSLIISGIVTSKIAKIDPKRIKLYKLKIIINNCEYMTNAIIGTSLLIIPVLLQIFELVINKEQYIQVLFGIYFLIVNLQGFVITKKYLCTKVIIQIEAQQ